MQNYYKFTPLLKTTLWGGSRISRYKHPGPPPSSPTPRNDRDAHIGESWELSGIPGSETAVAGTGTTLSQLLSRYRHRLVGHANYRHFGNRFPLLVKFIDAAQDLSIQVHPDDDVARRHGHPCGKSEMWYVIDAEPGATLCNGLRQPLTPHSYRQHVADGTISQCLARHTVSPGDCFYIPAGRIHAIGAGCLLVEIQQAADITYRIYDYNRTDRDGRPRQLHTELAAEAICYDVQTDYRQPVTPCLNRRRPLVECPCFTTAVYDLDQPMLTDYSQLDSFVILIGLKGQGTLTIDREHTTLRQGETILLPATINTVRAEGTLKYLEAYVVPE